MGPEGSFPHSQVSATCPYPEPAQSSPYPHILLEFFEGLNLLLCLVSYVDIAFALNVNKDLETPYLAEEYKLATYINYA
jgi:hypothetical protein